jgi:hypothetical protein
VKSEQTRRGATPPGRRTPLRIRVLTIGAAVALAASTVPASAAGSAWYLGQFGMSSLWKTTAGSGAVVAEVDTGVNAADADLSGRIKPEVGMQGGSVKPATSDSSSAYDGTDVASLIVGTGAGGSRIQGLAPKASVLPIQVQDQSANGMASSAGAAIYYAVQHGARIILFPKPLPNTSSSFEAAVKYAVQNNAIVIAAAGNNGSDAVIGDPCTAPGALCISATTSSGSVAPLSSVGPAVTLGAPGSQIPVPTKTGGTTTDSSTHYAAALAAGEAALVWSAHPGWTAGQVVRVMLNNVSQGNAQHTRVNDGIGYGIIDPAAAVAADTPPQVTNPLLPVVPTASPSKPGTSATPTHTSAAPASSGSSFPWLWVGLGVAVLVLAGAIGAIFLRNRRPKRRNYLSEPAFLPPTHQMQAPNSWPPDQAAAWPQPGQNPPAAQSPQGTQYSGALQGTTGWPPPEQAPQQSPVPWPNQQQPQQSPVPWPDQQQPPRQSPLPWPPAPPTPPPGGEPPRQD